MELSTYLNPTPPPIEARHLNQWRIHLAIPHPHPPTYFPNIRPRQVNLPSPTLQSLTISLSHFLPPSFSYPPTFSCSIPPLEEIDMHTEHGLGAGGGFKYESQNKSSSACRRGDLRESRITPHIIYVGLSGLPA